MPYKTKEELPKQVKENLPDAAEEIFKEAYNSASKQYKDPSKRRDNASLGETANKVAWAAVKKKYEKKDGKWVKK